MQVEGERNKGRYLCQEYFSLKKVGKGRERKVEEGVGKKIGS